MELLTQESLEAMHNVDVEINTELPKEERILDFIRQIGNPYCYRHSKYVVKVSYNDTDVTLEQRLLSYMRTKC